MSEITRRRAQDWPVFIGTRAEALAMLRSHRESGRLLSWQQQPSPVPGKVLVRYQLAERPVRVAAARRRVHPWVWVAAGTAALALLGGLGWAVWLALAAVVANADVLAGAAFVTLALLALAAGGGGTVVVTVIVRRW